MPRGASWEYWPDSRPIIQTKAFEHAGEQLMRQHHYAEGPPIAALKYHEPVDRPGCRHAGRRGGVGGTAAGGSAVEKVDVRVFLRYSWDSELAARMYG